ncbi:MAG: cytochrome C, partial [Deltaproteobacteria bacterium HGW-Deltaproteobacteria-24]
MKNTLIIILVIFIAMQFFQVEHTNPKTDIALEIQAPNEIKAILKKSCFDCHSNEAKYPWYANIAPVSWMISRHVNNARSLVNFSTWESYTQEEKDKKEDALQAATT